MWSFVGGQTGLQDKIIGKNQNCCIEGWNVKELKNHRIGIGMFM
jgi:hypothetical protein